MVALKNILSTALLASTALTLPAPLRRQTSSGSKRGAAYNDASSVQALDQNSAISWAYNWGASPNGELPQGVEFVPMLWGLKTIHEFVGGIETILAGGNVKYVMGFNEPDGSGQSSMTTSDAATNFLQFLTPYLGSLSLVSPGVTNSQSPGQGLDWMREFLGSCSQCGVSVLAVHWYGDTAEDFTQFVQQAMDLASAQGLKEVWVTEFALNEDLSSQSSSSNSADFLRQVQPWLDEQEMVTRYAYFWAQDGFLVDGGSPSEAGQAYISG